MSESKEEVFVGIDVSKSTLEVRIEPLGESFQVANDDEGVKALCSRLNKLDTDADRDGGHRWVGDACGERTGRPRLAPGGG